ncbi:MAG: caspase family protein [Spirochaetaceae bacterium]|nr:MAG: caspase family protein [Spirochaetaceae bacterium]
MRRLLVLLLIAVAGSAVLTSPVAAQERTVRRFGLYVGANDGGTGREVLRWAVSDANRVADVMSELGSVHRADTYVLRDPNIHDIRFQFDHIASRVAAAAPGYRRTEFIFYYSGHSDETGIMLGNEHLSYSELRAAITSVGSDVTIAILDSCASGAFTRLKGGAFVQPLALDDGSDLTGHAFLSSSSADEASQESDQLRSSFFTHYLVSGLRGAADATGDRLVTLDEAYRFARDHTLQRTINTFAGPQTASFDFQLTGTGSLVLTNLATFDSGVILDASVLGRLFVTRRAGGIVAEVDKSAATPMKLALPAGDYVLTLQGDQRNFAHEVRLSSGNVTNVSSRDFRVTQLDRNRIRGGEITTTPLSVTLVPGHALVGESDPHTVNLSVGVIVGNAYRVEGGQASGIVSLTNENLTGVQFASIGNVVAGNLIGLQHAGIFNVVSGDSIAVQNSGIFNRIDGHGAVLQNAGIFNHASAGFDGVQSAGIFNTTLGIVNGAQIAGIHNRAGMVVGGQISLVNVSGDVAGAQIGLVNIGERVTGAQIGLVNISRELYGVPIGLVNFVENGIRNTGLWWEGDERTWITLQNGSNIFYALVNAGITRGGSLRELEGLGVSGGIGFRVKARPFYFDVDAGWKRVSAGTNAQERFSSLFDPDQGALLPTGRVIAGIGIGDGFGWFMGGSFDVRSSLGFDASGYFDRYESGIEIGSPDRPVVLYPTFITGFRF